jgi:DNA-binding transcriptional LysR family regulator
MELRHLRYFCMVAEERHVTRAAERLNLAQPALTQQIKALETELQTPLLRRVGRGIELTPSGLAFWVEAKAILDQVRTAIHITQQTGRGLAGRLSIGLTETASFAPAVTAVLKQARVLWPKVEISLMQGRTEPLVAAVREHRVDVVFVRTPPPDDTTLQWQAFLTEGWLVVLPLGHPLAAGSTVSLAQLSNQSLILPRGRTGDGMRDLMQAAFAALPEPPRIVQETPEHVMTINLVAAGFGLTLVPEGLTGVRADAVVYRPLRSRPSWRTQILVVTRRDDPSPITANFLALAEATVARRGSKR